jgi:hypothetical protein
MDNSIDTAFNPRRLFLLLKRDLAHGYRGVLVAMAAVGGATIVISLLSMLGRAQEQFYTPFYVGLMILGGFIFSSGIFKELHQPGSGPFYLALPATTFEKLLSKVLITTIGFAVAILAFMTAVSALSEALNRAIFGVGHSLFNPISRASLQVAAFYLVGQSSYLLGSIWFRKTAFLKTVLATAVVAIGVSIVLSVIFRFLFAGLFTGGNIRPDVLQLFSKDFGHVTVNGAAADTLSKGAQAFYTFIQVFFFGVCPAACWVASYFRLRETEV